MIARELLRSPLPGLFALLALVGGCGGNVVVDGGGVGGGGAGGGDTNPSSQFGTPTAACLIDTGVKVCEQTFDASSGQQLEAACSASSGSSVEACPTAEVSGCCLVTASTVTLEVCFYGPGASVEQARQFCKTQRGKFTSTP